MVDEESKKRSETQVNRTLNFDESIYAWKPDINYREHPGAYCIGRGEQRPSLQK